MQQLQHDLVKLTEVVGAQVNSVAQQPVGHIKDIVIDKYSGEIAYVVLSVPNLTGVGDKLLALPWKALHFDPKQGSYWINHAKESLTNLAGFDKNRWPDAVDPIWQP